MDQKTSSIPGHTVRIELHTLPAKETERQKIYGRLHAKMEELGFSRAIEGSALPDGEYNLPDLAVVPQTVLLRANQAVRLVWTHSASILVTTGERCFSGLPYGYDASKNQ